MSESNNDETSSQGTAPLFVRYPESESEADLSVIRYYLDSGDSTPQRVVSDKIENIKIQKIDEEIPEEITEKDANTYGPVKETSSASTTTQTEHNCTEKTSRVQKGKKSSKAKGAKQLSTTLETGASVPTPRKYLNRDESDPSTWDPLLKMSPKIDPHKASEPLSKCPHCRKVEIECRLPPLEQLPPTRSYRFRDEESRLPPLEQLPPTRNYRFAETDVGTARVYPDPDLSKFEVTKPHFLCMLPFYLINLLYLSWLIADLCYSYGPYQRFKGYFTNQTFHLNRGMEIFAGVFIFLTNMMIVCKLVWNSPNYNGPPFSSASRSDKKWVAKLSILSCLPLVMLIIVAAIRKNVPMVLPQDKPIPNCENLGYPTHIRFSVLDHATIRGNHTNMFNTVDIWNSTHIATFAFDNIYDPENPQNYNFALSTVDGDIQNVTINYFSTSQQYTVNYHTANHTDDGLAEYFGGAWQETPNLQFPNFSPILKSKKLDNWRTKAFSEGSYLELFSEGIKKPWYRTLDREYNGNKRYMEACTSGAVDDKFTLIPSGIILMEFAKDVYDSTEGN